MIIRSDEQIFWQNCVTYVLLNIFLSLFINFYELCTWFSFKSERFRNTRFCVLTDRKCPKMATRCGRYSWGPNKHPGVLVNSVPKIRREGSYLDPGLLLEIQYWPRALIRNSIFSQGELLDQSSYLAPRSKKQIKFLYSKSIFIILTFSIIILHAYLIYG